MAVAPPRRDDAQTAIDALRAIPERRATAADIAATDVDDIMWAARVLDEQNQALRGLLSSSPSPSPSRGQLTVGAEPSPRTLSAEDSRSLEESVDAIRKLQDWVAASRMRPILDGSIVETLESIADRTGLPLSQLRAHNSHLAHFRATDELPVGTKLKVPKKRKSSNAPAPAAAPFTRESASGGASIVAANDDLTDCCVGARGIPGTRSVSGRSGGSCSGGQPQGRRGAARGDDDHHHHRQRASLPAAAPLHGHGHRRDEPPHPPHPSPSSSSGAARQSSRVVTDDWRSGATTPRTLATLSQQHRLPIDTIVADNPHLDVYGDDDILPPYETVTLHDALAQSQHTPPRAALSGGDRPHAGHHYYHCDAGDTLASVADLHRCTLDLVLPQNPALATRFHPDDPLPPRTVVALPADGRSQQSSRFVGGRARDIDIAAASTGSSCWSDSRPSLSRASSASAAVASNQSCEEAQEELYEHEEAERHPLGPLIRPGGAAGSSLSEIAWTLGVSVGALREVNPSADIYTAHDALPSSLLLRAPSSSATHLEATTPADLPPRARAQVCTGHTEWVIVRVRKGDTVTTVAKKLGVAPSLLLDANIDRLYNLVNGRAPSLYDPLPDGFELDAPMFDDPARGDSPQHTGRHRNHEWLAARRSFSEGEASGSSYSGFFRGAHSRDVEW